MAPRPCRLVGVIEADQTGRDGTVEKNEDG